MRYPGGHIDERSDAVEIIFWRGLLFARPRNRSCQARKRSSASPLPERGRAARGSRPVPLLRFHVWRSLPRPRRGSRHRPWPPSSQPAPPMRLASCRSPVSVPIPGEDGTAGGWLLFPAARWQGFSSFGQRDARRPCRQCYRSGGRTAAKAVIRSSRPIRSRPPSWAARSDCPGRAFPGGRRDPAPPRRCPGP